MNAPDPRTGLAKHFLNSPHPYWMEGVPPPSFPPLQENYETDVAVVGGGITGVTTAYLLQKSGLKIALIERGKIARADTGHTTAHLTYVTDCRLKELIRLFGKDGARLAWSAGETAIHEIEKIIRDENISCDFRRVPGYLMAPLEQESEAEEEFKAEAEQAQALGFEAKAHAQVEIFNRPGVIYPNQAIFHPLQYINRLVEIIRERGGLIFEDSTVEKITSDPPTVHANDGSVRCRRIIIATHNPIVGARNPLAASVFQTKLALYTSYAIGATAPAGTFPEALFWDTSDPYYYLRIHRTDNCDYLIFGGKDHKTGQMENEAAVCQELADVLIRHLPEIRIDRCWSGQVIETPDGLPYIGPNTDTQFIATGFGGNGMTFGTVAALMAHDWIRGIQNPWAELFDSTRRVPLRELKEYASENLDYPYHLVKEYVAPKESLPPESLQCGEARLLKHEGKHLAAYRDESGELFVRSAICTHLGCIVRWNSLEHSWDCPCHGSRFRPSGEVLAGPAEQPLAEIGKEGS